MNKLVNYLKASWEELGKVIWPTRRQAARLTLVVVVFSGILALYMTVLDSIFRTALQKLILKG